MNTAHSKAIMVLCFLVAALFVIFSKFRISTDLALFLPEPVTKFEKLLHHQLRNSASANIIFLGFSGLAPTELAGFNRRMTARLRQSDKFSRVVNNADSLSEGTLAFLQKNRYLLTHKDLSEQFSIAGLKAALAARLEGLASASASVEKNICAMTPPQKSSPCCNSGKAKSANTNGPPS